MQSGNLRMFCAGLTVEIVSEYFSSNCTRLFRERPRDGRSGVDCWIRRLFKSANWVTSCNRNNVTANSHDYS